MAKRKITVTVDEQLVEAVKLDRDATLSAVVNSALAAEVDRRAQLAALTELLREWESEAGPVPAEARATAAAAFDELDASGSHPDSGAA